MSDCGRSLSSNDSSFVLNEGWDRCAQEIEVRDQKFEVSYTRFAGVLLAGIGVGQEVIVLALAGSMRWTTFGFAVPIASGPAMAKHSVKPLRRLSTPVLCAGDGTPRENFSFPRSLPGGTRRRIRRLFKITVCLSHTISTRRELN